MLLTKINSTVLRAPTRPPMSKQKWRRRKVPRWLVGCAPHQAIGSLIPPDVCFGAGCPPEGLISRRLSSPCYGGPANRLRVQLFESLFGSTRLTTLEFLCAAQSRLIPRRRTDYNQNCAAQQLF